MQGWQVLIDGRIQGVGFRPFIYRIARKLNIKGTVKNTTRGVEIMINTDRESLDNFIEKIKAEAPSIAVIRHIEHRPAEAPKINSFNIAPSDPQASPTLELTPDFAMCRQCAREIDQATDRRHDYAFTTCTYCGPRYSIIEKLPYDRERTTMSEFKMCADCTTEYRDPEDRRFHSQTNSCPQCKISIELHHPSVSEKDDHTNLISEVGDMWKNGKILAIKGLCGYLLTCDLSGVSTVTRLREVKRRPSKPFAVMCPDINYVADNFHITDPEKTSMLGYTAPIVLLAPKEPSLWNMGGIAPGLSKIGVMIPYTPLFKLLLDEFGHPIIATSGNITNAPISYSDQEAVGHLGSLVDAVLSYNRKIIMPQDDSVIQFSPFNHRKIILRRSRGMAPSHTFEPNAPVNDQVICAMGGDLKSSFGFLNQGKLYISQYLGDLSHFDTQERYQMVLQHFFGLFRKDPEMILADDHPGYHSTRIGKELSVKLEVPFYSFQHHKAHFGAVLAENSLLLAEGPILGVCWDGTGYGDDGQVWGGEFFLKKGNKLMRKGHFSYYNHLAGDKMPAEPRLSAFSLAHDLPGDPEPLKAKFSENEWNNYHRLVESNTLLTSSAGRLFDAVASITGICDKNNFEGQAAMLLEEYATRFARSRGLENNDFYEIEIGPDHQCNVRKIMEGILADQAKKLSPEEIAFKFHFSMVRMMDLMAERLEVEKIAFSGGVFQNALITDMIIHHLKQKYQLYFHKRLSPNDENIPYGQLHLYLQAME